MWLGHGLQNRRILGDWKAFTIASCKVFGMQQRLQLISNEKVRQWVGMPTSLEVMIACWMLQWQGHVARMDDSRLPKQLFVWMAFSPASCPWRQAKLEG